MQDKYHEKYKKFQSTLPQGERQCQEQVCVLRNGISIHAPARGATVGVLVDQDAGTISIHAPARGATICYII